MAAQHGRAGHGLKQDNSHKHAAMFMLQWYILLCLFATAHTPMPPPPTYLPYRHRSSLPPEPAYTLRACNTSPPLATTITNISGLFVPTGGHRAHCHLAGHPRAPPSCSIPWLPPSLWAFMCAGEHGVALLHSTRHWRCPTGGPNAVCLYVVGSAGRPARLRCCRASTTRFNCARAPCLSRTGGRSRVDPAFSRRGLLLSQRLLS